MSVICVKFTYPLRLLSCCRWLRLSRKVFAVEGHKTLRSGRRRGGVNVEVCFFFKMFRGASYRGHALSRTQDP